MHLLEYKLFSYKINFVPHYLNNFRNCQSVHIFPTTLNYKGATEKEETQKHSRLELFQVMIKRTMYLSEGIKMTLCRHVIKPQSFLTSINKWLFVFSHFLGSIFLHHFVKQFLLLKKCLLGLADMTAKMNLFYSL